jgi:hypothetical protein
MHQLMDTKTTPLAQFLKSAIANSGKSHDQIAIEVGYEKGSVVQMMADGLIKVPINKIRPIAAALAVDPPLLCGLLLHEYFPDLVELIEQVYDRPLLSQNERSLIQALRRHTEGNDGHAVVVDAREVIAVVMV